MPPAEITEPGWHKINGKLKFRFRNGVWTPVVKVRTLTPIEAPDFDPFAAELKKPEGDDFAGKRALESAKKAAADKPIPHWK